MPATGEIYQVTFRGFYGSTTCENVLNFQQLSPLVTEAAIKTGVERFWFLTQTLQGFNYNYDSMIVKRMTPVPLDESIVTPLTVTHGQASGAGLNSTVSLILTLRTGFAGKSHRGRIYISGITDNLANPNQNTLSPAGGVIAASAAANLLAEFGPSGTNTAVRLGVYSRIIGGSHPFTLAGWQQITGVDVQPVFGNQRRRRQGVGI